MNPVASEFWPWLELAGLGAFHGLNPAMGWLFAVALGLHRHSRRLVWLSPLPLAAGHALSIALVAAAFLLAGFVIGGGGEMSQSPPIRIFMPARMVKGRPG